MKEMTEDELISAIVAQARDTKTAIRYWKNEELKDGHAGHKIGRMRPYLAVMRLCELINKLNPQSL